MNKVIITFIFAFSYLLISQNLSASTQDSITNITKEALCKNWVLKEYKENGKNQELYEYEIEFFANGKYVEEEEGELDKGVWELNENKTVIVFDKNTLDQDEFLIVSFEPKKMVVKLFDETNYYQFILVPSE